MKLEELLLSDFPKISDQEWKEKVMKDLRGKDFEETLVWTDENKIQHQPYYRKSDLANSEQLKAVQQAQRMTRDWQILESKPELNDSIADFVSQNKIEKFSWNEEVNLLDLTVYKSKGATIVHELALGLHHVLEYMDAITESGITADEAAKKLKFAMAFGNSYFSEIAKARAFRYLLAKLFSAYGINVDAQIVGIGSDYYLAHEDAHTNLLRTTTQAMSAVLGGCNELYIPAFDENANSSELGKRMARNIQLILKEESHFGNVIDPASGSYYIEYLTEEIANKAWQVFVEIEEKGGLFKIIESGYLKEMLEGDKKRRIEEYKSGDRVLLGVNKFKNDKGVDLDLDQTVENLAKEVQA